MVAIVFALLWYEYQTLMAEHEEACFYSPQAEYQTWQRLIAHPLYMETS
jgi:hypothetical protein